MKKLLLVIGIYCILLPAKAQQPSLSSSEMLPFGSVMTLTPVDDFTVVDTTIKGANASWDFSKIEGSGDPDLSVSIVNPSSTPYASTFSTSNYAYKEGPTLAYRYFNLTSTKMERLGSVSGGVTKTYSDTQVEYIFPLTMGASNLDHWENNISSFGGEYNMYCIGYGTLKLPGATYTNALMVRVDVTELFEWPVYFWYSSDNGAILFEYLVGDGFFVGTGGYYLKSLQVGATNATDAAFAEELKYNNPVEDKLNLSFKCSNSSDLSYSVISSMGETLSSGALPYSASDVQELQLNTSDLRPGIYFVKLNLDQASQTIRFVKK